ncbi:hypothetical protein H7K06_24515 [Priestia aryabhattai]|uniref:hypothetical protein n=1 Tax=Priestia aryabhattai TaxID=412384 RepID=UPI001C8EDA38|nr:hypothetical protein [Priestia aryabhattai]MBX9970698.1 hypothetical protein [Priestia aryabhattai]
MRKIVLIGTALLLSTSILGACGKKDTAKTEEINRVSYTDITNKLISDQDLSKYLSSAEIIQKEDASLPNFYGVLNDSFDLLSEKKQYDFFRRAQNLASKAYSSKNICAEDNGCIMDEFDLKTAEHTYNMDYDYDNPKTNYLSIDNGTVVYSPHFGLANQENNSAKNAATDDKDKEVTAPSENKILSTNMNIYTADGDNWNLLTSSQKTEMIEKEISNLESTGGSALEEPQWFIDALDAYYGDPATNPTKVTEIFTLSGKAGGVLISNE